MMSNDHNQLNFPLQQHPATTSFIALKIEACCRPEAKSERNCSMNTLKPNINLANIKQIKLIEEGKTIIGELSNLLARSPITDISLYRALRTQKIIQL